MREYISRWIMATPPFVLFLQVFNDVFYYPYILNANLNSDQTVHLCFHVTGQFTFEIFPDALLAEKGAVFALF